jgi:hypothetical protein
MLCPLPAQMLRSGPAPVKHAKAPPRVRTRHSPGPVLTSSMIINFKTAKALGLAIPPSVVRHVGSATIEPGF